MPGIPDRGNEKPALSKARQKEKATGGERERERSLSVTQPGIFIEQLDFLFPPGSIVSLSTVVNRNSKGFLRKLRARFTNPRKEYFFLYTYPSKDRPSGKCNCTDVIRSVQCTCRTQRDSVACVKATRLLVWIFSWIIVARESIWTLRRTFFKEYLSDLKNIVRVVGNTLTFH